MAIIDSFDPADRSKIASLPMLVGMAVTAADPGGLWGAIKESTAMAGAIAKAKAAGGNELIEAVVANFGTSEGRGAVTDILKTEIKGKKPDEIVTGLLGEIGRLSTLIDSKAPEAAPGFKSWLMEIAQGVAEAGTEGGFMGFGGVKVSPEEAATLDKLRSTLGASGGVGV